MYKLAMEEEQGQIDKLNAQPGVKVFTKGPKDRAAWVELVKPVNVKLAGESGAKEILDYMVKTGAAH